MVLNQLSKIQLSLKVVGNISKIKGNIIEFEVRKESTFDAIVLAT
jgi:indole-3-pyruvate monooxygenase